MRFLRFLPLLLLPLALVASRAAESKKPDSPPPIHSLVGGWRATDGTIFNFRNDHTFRGIDMDKREIWGNWVSLSPTRIGFQTLMHKGSYKPQYAIIGNSNTRMNYIVSNGDNYIPAERIAADEAEEITDTLMEPKVAPLPSGADSGTDGDSR